MFAFRDFYITHQGKQIGRATSTWTLVDLSTKSMANVAEVMANNKFMYQHDKREDDLIYGKIRLPEKFDVSKTFEVRFDDLDVNKHVNNANYIVWAIEPLSFDFRRSHKLKTVDMMFKKEITYGNKVLSEVAVNGNTTTHAVKNAETGEELYVMSAEWIEK